METVTATQNFSGNLDEFVAYTRTLSSRTNWPGAVLEYEQPDALHYSVGLRLKGAAITDIHIEDKLGEIERLEDGAVVYSTTQKVLWPAGHADAITEYRFTPGADGTHTVEFTYSYPPPSTKLVKTKALPDFRAGMEKVSGGYLKKLVKACDALVAG